MWACRGLLALLLIVAPAAAVAGRGPEIAALRHFSSPAHTRLVLELSAPGAPVVHALPAGAGSRPRRVYLDLAGFAVGTGVPRSLSLPRGPVSEVRIGSGDADTLRVVLVLGDAEGYEAFRLSGPPRLVVDVRAARPGGPATMARADDAAPGAKPMGKAAAGGAGAPAAAARDASAGTANVAREPERAPRPPASRSRAARGAAGRAGSAAGRAEPAPAARSLKIVLDPGHGGKDPGARGEGGLLEKNVVLDIAKLLAARLEREMDATVVLTRERDVFLTLEERTARANAENADLFVSIHANASPRPELAGVETYYLNNTDDRATVRLAAMENGLRFIGNGRHAGGDELSYILSDLVQDGKLQDSIALSQALQAGLLSQVRDAYPEAEVADLGIKQGPFYVLVGAYMPCVLVEVAFLTNPVEGRRLATAAYRETIAAGLARGVKAYAGTIRRAHTL